MTSLLLSYFVHNAQNQSANISAFHDCTFTMKRRSTCDKFIALKLLEKLYNIAILFSLVYYKIKRNVGYAEKGYGRVGRNVKMVRLMTGLVDRPGWLDWPA